MMFAVRSLNFIKPSQVRSISYTCPPVAGSTSAVECMNRNKRRVNPANHGARPCNSVGRKSRSMKAGGWNPLGLRPNQTRQPIKPHGMPMTSATVTMNAPARS